MWSEVDAVKVVVWRMLNRLKSEGWTQDILDMIYLEEETLKWAASTGEGDDESEAIVHKDANGVILQNGDTVVLTKDLNVRGGASFTAKRGTAVRRISLVWDNAEQIEGKVEGQQIVILTQFVDHTYHSNRRTYKIFFLDFILYPNFNLGQHDRKAVN